LVLGEKENGIKIMASYDDVGLVGARRDFLLMGLGCSFIQNAINENVFFQLTREYKRFQKSNSKLTIFFTIFHNFSLQLLTGRNWSSESRGLKPGRDVPKPAGILSKEKGRES